MGKFFLALFGFFGVVALIATVLSLHTVEEGQVGILKHFGEVQSEVLLPGLHVLNPITSSVEELEVRERRLPINDVASTKNQLPIKTIVSVNWGVSREAARELYVNFGSLGNFEEKILGPKLRQASKEGLARFNADELIRDRGLATTAILEVLQDDMRSYPVSITSLQLEDIDPPQAYKEAIEQKERAREDAQRQRYVLEQQKLKAQELVQTADADAQAQKLRADAEAYAVLVKAEAEAKGIREVANAIAENQVVVDYNKWTKTWNGELPRILFSGENAPNMLMQMPLEGRLPQ